MMVYVKKRHNGQTNVRGTKVAELPKFRKRSTLIGVKFPESTLIEWFDPDQVSEVSFSTLSVSTSQMELF